MANRRLTSELVVRLLDKVSGPAKQISRGLMGVRDSASKVGRTSVGDRLATSIARNQAQLDRTRGRLVDAAAGFYAIKNAIGAPVQAAMQFESAMADVKKVVDFDSDKAFQTFQRDLEKLSTILPVSTAQLADIAASAGEAGFAGDELLKVTEAAAKIGVAFGVSAEQAGDALPQMMNAMGLTLDEVILLSDGINHLSNNMAASAPKVLNFMNRIGGDIGKFGFSAEEASAFGAAMIAAGAQSDVAATSFRNMGNRLTKGASATKRQKVAFKQLGMNAEDVARKMQEDAVGTTVEVLEAMSALPKEMQAAISSDLFGDEARALAPLLGNIDLLRESLGYVSNEAEYAGSAFKEFEVRNSTYGAEVQRFNNRLTNMKAAIGRGLIPVLADLIEKITPVIDKVTQWSNAHPELIGQLAAAAAGVVAFKSTLIGLRFVGLLGKGGGLYLLAGGFRALSTAARGAGAIGTAVSESVRLQQTLAKFDGKSVGALGRVSAGLRGIAGVTGLSAISSAIGAVVGAIATISAPVWIGIAGAVAAVGAAWKYWDRITAILGGVASAIGQQLKPVLDGVREFLAPLEPIIRPVADAFSSFGNAVSGAITTIRSILSGGIFERELLSDDDVDRLGVKAAQITNNIINGLKALPAKLASIGTQAIQSLWDGMKQAFKSLINWVKNIPARIKAAIGTIDLSGIIKMPSFAGVAGSSTRGGGRAGGAKSTGIDPRYRRARGGPIRAGSDYLVGEEGEEVITPDRNGWVTNNREIIAGLRQRAQAAAAAGAVAAAPAAAAAPPQINVNMAPVTIQGVQDIRGAAEEISQIMADETRRALDGAFFDGGK